MHGPVQALTAMAAVAMVAPAMVHATPFANSQKPKYCKTLGTTVSKLSAAKSATPFCQSFLHVKTSTKTKHKVTTITHTAVKTVHPVITETDATAAVTSLVSSIITLGTDNCTSIPTTPVPYTSPTTLPPHHGLNVKGNTVSVAPTVPTPSVVKGAPSTKISSLCHCLDLPKPTTTVTSTSTCHVDVHDRTTIPVTSDVTATDIITTTGVFATYTCACTDPPGWQYADYHNPYSATTISYPNFAPEAFKTASPSFTGVAPTIGISDDTVVYGTANTDDLNAVDHRGYFLPPANDTYTFAIIGNAPDNILLGWQGADAYSGWNRANSDQYGSYGDPNTSKYTVSFTLQQGVYFPIRVMYGNGGGIGNFQYAIYNSSGASVESGNVVQYGCNPADQAPQYAPFGSET